MNERLYLLDTNVVLALVRGQALGAFIDGKYSLRASKVRPFVCVVTLGEVRVLAHRNGWGSAKFEALEHALTQFVTIDINRPQVLDAYVALDLASQSHPSGSRNMGKNGLWIAAAAKAAKARSSRRTTTSPRHLHRRRGSVHRPRRNHDGSAQAPTSTDRDYSGSGVALSVRGVPTERPSPSPLLSTPLDFVVHLSPGRDPWKQVAIPAVVGALDRRESWNPC